MTQAQDGHRRSLRLRASFVLVTCVAAVAAGGCGGDEQKRSDSGPTAAPPAASKGGADPRSTIQEWFTARRLGEGEAGCALETERFQTEQYGGPGQPCLDDAANKQPQAVWAETIKIVSLEESGESAVATIEPNAGTPDQAQVGLVKTADGWLVDTFR